eukprot:scaffold408661_cov48-Prasinocladus_malaysianus.AAC.2
MIAYILTGCQGGRASCRVPIATQYSSWAGGWPWSKRSRARLCPAGPACGRSPANNARRRVRRAWGASRSLGQAWCAIKLIDKQIANSHLPPSKAVNC